jgi:hypothetical protein
MNTKANENVLGEMLGALANAFTEERKKAEPYKEMFKAGSTHTGLLRDLEHKMMNHVLDACEVFEARHGIKVNNEQFHVLMALPLLAKIAKKNADKNEGMGCGVDKAFFILSEQIIALGK